MEVMPFHIEEFEDREDMVEEIQVYVSGEGRVERMEVVGGKGVELDGKEEGPGEVVEGVKLPEEEREGIGPVEQEEERVALSEDGDIDRTAVEDTTQLKTNQQGEFYT